MRTSAAVSPATVASRAIALTEIAPGLQRWTSYHDLDLPVQSVLVSHGAPVLQDGKDALRTLLRAR